MSKDCCATNCSASSANSPRYRRVLWIALCINTAMFFVETVAGTRAGSVSLLADSMDFLGDAANYGISLWVLGMSLAYRAKASLLKAASMAAFGIWVLGRSVWSTTTGVIPDASTMGSIGVLALMANMGVAALLYTYREGDSNMRSVWLCTRNDAIGNVAVMFAAAGVFGTDMAWPDLVVALTMSSLALHSSWTVIRQARNELIRT